MQCNDRLNKIHSSYFVTSKFYYPLPMTLPLCSLPLLLGQSCSVLLVWSTQKAHRKTTGKKTTQYIKITRQEEEAVEGEKRDCICDKGEGRDKGEIEETDRKKKDDKQQNLFFRK